MCADNLKVYKEINNEKGAMKLPEDMDMVYDWGLGNVLRFHIKQCNSSVLTPTKSTQGPVCAFNDEKLRRVESVKDLSVIVNYNMSFHVHIANTVNKAYKGLGFVMRNSKHLNCVCVYTLS